LLDAVKLSIELYNYDKVFMDALPNKVRECGLLGALCDTHVFNPIPYWAGERSLRDRHVESVTASGIIHCAVAVNGNWQTSKKSGLSLVERGSHSRVQARSLWSDLLRALAEKACSQTLQPSPQPSQECLQPALKHRRMLMFKVVDPEKPIADPLPWIAVEPHESCRSWAFHYRLAARSDWDRWKESNMRTNCQLIRNLGEGAYGKVFVAKYVKEWSLVAIKVSKTESLHHTVSPMEVACFARLPKHPNVVAMHDHFYSPWFCAIAFELMDTDLVSVLRYKVQGQAFSFEVSAHIAVQMAFVVVIILQFAYTTIKKVRSY